MSGQQAAAQPRVELDYVPQVADGYAIRDYFATSWLKYMGVDRDPLGTMGWLPTSIYWTPAVPIDPRPAEPQAGAVEYVAKAQLDHVVLNPGCAAGISGMNTVDLAVEWARAANDWTVEQWLTTDPRFRGSVVVAPQDPAAAAREIRRIGSHPGMVQVVLAFPRSFLGTRAYLPIMDAAADLGLAVTLEGRASYFGVNRGYAGYGHPESMLEYQLSNLYGAQPHLISMIAQGVFDRHPSLKLILNGFGCAWLPSVVWGFDGAGDVESYGHQPLSRGARDYVTENVRLGTTGIEVPAQPGALAELLGLVDGSGLLLGASGTELDRVLAALPDDWRPNVLGRNAVDSLDFGR